MEIGRLLAPNPGPFTGPGTNTYVVVVDGAAAIIDPGPRIASHAAAIERALDGLEPVAVLVTHNHPDHAPLANPLAERLEVPSYGFAPGPDFSPDVMLADGGIVAVDTEQLIAVHTPGHTWDHLCFLAGSQLFTGDHIMGGSTVIIEDAAAYLASLRRVESLGVDRLLPGHGGELEEAAQVVSEYIEHRRERELQIIAAVAGGANTMEAIVMEVYAAIDARLYAAAARQVQVQLEKLVAENRLSWVPASHGEVRVAVPD